MDTSRRNPFTPSFGMVPPHLAGRSELLENMHGAFGNGPGDPNLSTLLIGARGTGKTALLSTIACDASSQGWISANVSAVPGLLDDIVQRAEEEASELIGDDVRSHVTGIGIGQLFNVEFERDASVQPNWRTKMNLLFKRLSTYDTGVLITVDEVDADLDEMVTLASAYQHFVREGKKVALVMAGLPYAVSSLVNNKSVSFLRRCRQHYLGRISASDIETALVATIEDAGGSVDEAACEAAVEAIDGFPYMMQLVGYRMWACSRDGHITAGDARRGITQAAKEMRDGVLGTTFRELSAGDIRFLTAMLPDAEESELSVIASRMGVRSNYASEYKSRLLAQGVIGERGGGYLGFDIPGFREYLAERVDERR